MVDTYEISQYINELISNPLMVPFIISMLPIAELRIAIPWAILVQKLPWYNSVLISMSGSVSALKAISAILAIVIEFAPICSP